MHIWTITTWEKYYDLSNPKHRKGLRTRFEKGIDPEVRAACLRFCVWLRAEYFFPIRIPIYFKQAERIRAMDGEMVCATFFEPINKHDEPYARVATGDYQQLKEEMGRDDALASVLLSVAHELTHYFQWINDVKLTTIGEERQASRYARIILDEYADDVEHP